MRGENAESSRDTIEDSLPVVKFTLEQRSSGQAKIVTFATLHESVHDDHLENTIRHKTNRFLQSRKIKIGSEDLLQCAVNIYHGIRVPFSNMYGA